MTWSLARPGLQTTVSGAMTDTGRTVILNFHGIGTPARPLEPGEAAFWMSPRQFATVLDRAALSSGPKVQITFDDGNRSDLSFAAPELARRGLTASFFPLTARLGQPGSLSRSDLTALIAMGHDIGLHGHRHVDWRRLDVAGAAHEYDDALSLLQDIAGRRITAAAVPFGAYDRSVLRALATRGISAVYTSDRGAVTGSPWIRPRCCLRSDTTPDQLDAILAGRIDPLRRLRRLVGMTAKRLI